MIIVEEKGCTVVYIPFLLVTIPYFVISMFLSPQEIPNIRWQHECSFV